MTCQRLFLFRKLLLVDCAQHDLISTGASLQTEQSTEQIVAEAITDESFIEEYCYEDMNEYSIMESMYEEGIDSEEITNLDTEN